MVEWMRDTYAHLKNMILVQDVFWDNVQVRQCSAPLVENFLLTQMDSFIAPGVGGVLGHYAGAAVPQLWRLLRTQQHPRTL